MSPLAHLFDNISSYKSSFSERLGVGSILIYGAGNTGRAVASHLTLNNYQIDGFIDKNATDSQVCLKIPVFTLSEAFKRYGASVTVLVAIHNRSVDIVGLLEDIESVGFKNVFSMYDYAKTFPGDKAFRYFLGDPCSLINEKESAEKFFSMLADDSSKHIYLDLLKFRLSGNYTFCPKPSFRNQYAPLDLARWQNPMRLIDCGAFNGDSIRLFKSYQYQIEQIIAFEPDLKNYQSLIKNSQNTNVIFLPCGVSNTAKSVLFNDGEGEGSRVSGDGSIAIQMLSIDEAFPDPAPNLIKMDIEGGERDAILGAQQTIKKYKPGLAISAYHLPADLWQLGLLISEIDSSYRFHMRSHGYSSFDTVLYAVSK
jgi:FkbM family methyltransferase